MYIAPKIIRRLISISDSRGRERPAGGEAAQDPGAAGAAAQAAHPDRQAGRDHGGRRAGHPAAAGPGRPLARAAQEPGK